MPMQSTNCQRGTLLGLSIGDALGAAVEFELPGTFAEVTGYRYFTFFRSSSNLTCAGILLFSKSVSGPKGGQASLPNHAGFSFR